MGDPEKVEKQDVKEKEKCKDVKEKEKCKDVEEHASTENADKGSGKDKDKKKKKEKNPDDKKDLTKLHSKLEKLESKIQALNVKKEEILKLINDAEHANVKPSEASKE